MNRRVRNLLGILLACAITFAPHVGRAAPYAPLDCKKAATPAEKTICGNYGLGQDEARLATLFSVLTSLVAMGQRADLTDAQRKWVSVRDACGSDAGCLAHVYQARINELCRHSMLWRSEGRSDESKRPRRRIARGLFGLFIQIGSTALAKRRDHCELSHVSTSFLTWSFARPYRSWMTPSS